MSIPDEYKVEHLFLLVGENPLPNYVAARTLLKEGGTVSLVFTNQTKEQKNCLKKGLKNKNLNIKDVDLAGYESNAYHICDRIQKKIKPIRTESVGLNYTGGTKAMAVHAYRAIKELKPNAVFSYLDPRRLKMCIDQENNKDSFYDVALELSLEELFKLHNDNFWREDIPPIPQPCLPEVAAKFAEFYADKNLTDEERKSFTKKLRNQAKNNDKWKEEKDLESISIRLNNLPEKFQSFKKILIYELDASTEELSLNITKNKGFKSCTQLCEWLDGTWLESYVLQQVQKIQDEFGIKESMMSFHIKLKYYQDKDRFEFDVAFIQGYQLFVISCTTSNKKDLCKEKLFEAHLRARQLGGDEARVALVCYFHTPKWIEEDMEFAIKDRKIKVFGRDDVVNLAGGIKEWIKEVEDKQKNE